MAEPFKSRSLSDALFSFEAGMNAGVAPLLLPKNQCAFITNGTVRGTFVRHRPPFKKIPLSFTDGVTQGYFHNKFQGAGYFRPDNGTGSIMAAISGRLFQISITGSTASVAEKAVAGDPTYPNPSTRPQAWLWQSEKWCIYNDGASNPIFYDGTTATRSTYGTPLNYNTTSTGTFTIPAVSASATVNLTDVTNLLANDIVTVPNRGTFQVLSITPTGGTTADVVLQNLTGGPVGYVVASAITYSWSHASAQLPPGRMGAYGMGRNWVSLIDGKQFIASDLVGGSSGTQALNYRDAVLNITENLYLAGGGNFTVPGNVGDIKAMRFMSTLDKSLGQGPLQVLTSNTIFSCDAPVDRLIWQDVTNPILTESLISNGGLSHNSTVLANGDMLFRSVDGIRSLILARRDFNTWGNVPASFEVDPIIREDSQSLLPYTSAVVFDNRFLLTTAGATSDMGVYWRGLIALNFDPVSSLRGKAPSVYDGLWTGLNTLQMIVGDFNSVERCFALTLNTITEELELYEILRDNDGYYDNDVRRIVWEIESPVLEFGQRDKSRLELMRLIDGEIKVDNLLGNVDFQVFYRPDQWPCWIPWHQWRECAKAPDASDPSTVAYKPQFRPNMGLGEPSPVPCDETNNRPMREGYTFQIKIVITGHCRFIGAKFRAVTMPEPVCSKQVCDAICLDESVEDSVAAISTVTLVNALQAVTQNDGTVVPIITGAQQIQQATYGRVYNISDGLWYDLNSYTENDGSVVPICGQTPHTTPT